MCHGVKALALVDLELCQFGAISVILLLQMFCIRWPHVAEPGGWPDVEQQHCECDRGGERSH